MVINVLMSPTEILGNQHYNLSKKFLKTQYKNKFLTGKTECEKKNFRKLKNGKIDLLIGTHALFQKKIIFKKLGLVVIDEQHKFGVNQRSDLAIKIEMNRVLLMSATPIPLMR